MDHIMHGQRVRRRALAVWVVVMATAAVTLVLAANAARDTVVALAITYGGDTGRDVLDLAEAQLSHSPGLVIADRQNIERALKEQALLAYGTGAGRQASVANSLFGVDVFAALETDPERKANLGLVVYDAGSGLTLGCAPLVASNAAENVKTVVDAVQAACAKRLLPPEKRVCVSLVAVRNVSLPRECDPWCAAVGRLLMRRLVGSPDVFVLEREHLGLVNQETSLVGVRGDLLAALARLEIEVTGVGASGAQVTLTVRGADGVVIARPSVESPNRDAGAVVGKLVEGLLAALKAHPSAVTASGADEAEQFAHEAEFCRAHGDAPQAFCNAEAALALGPGNRTLCMRMGNVYRSYFGANSSVLEWLDSMSRAVQLFEQAHRLAIAATGSPQAGGPVFNAPEFWRQFGAASFLVQDVSPAARQAEAREQLVRLHHSVGALVIGVLLPNAVERGRRGEEITRTLNDLLMCLDLYASEPGAWTAVTEGVPAFCAYYQTNAMDHGWIRTAPRMMARLGCLARGSQTSPFAWGVDGRGAAHPWPDQTIATLRPVFKKMQQQVDPCIKGYGLLGEIALDDRGGAMRAAERDQRVAMLRAWLRSEAKSPSRHPTRRFTDMYREAAYGTELDLIDTLYDDDRERMRQYLDLYEFMMRENHLNYWVALTMTSPNVFRFRHYFGPISGGQYSGVGADLFPTGAPVWTEKDFPELAARGRQVRQRLKAGGYTGSGLDLFSFETGTFAQDFDKWQAPIFAVRPDLVPAPARAWALAQRLGDAGQLGGEVVAFLRVRTNEVRVLVSRSGGLRVVDAPFNGPALVVMDPGPGTASRAVRCATEYDGRVFVGTASGIEVLGPGRSQSTHWGPADGMPNGDVQSLAIVDDTLFAVLGSGLIVAHTNGAATWNVVASARRKEKQSPFDDTTFDLSSVGMVADAPRHRVIFSASTGAVSDPLNGLWAIDAASHAITKLISVYRTAFGLYPTAEGQLLLGTHRFSELSDSVAEPYLAVAYDPAAGKGTLIACMSGYLRGGGPELPATRATPELPMTFGGPLALTAGELWYGGGWVARAGADAGDYPPLSCAGKPVPIGWAMLATVPGGKSVVAYNNGDEALWLLSMTPAAPSGP